jgi:hypothetical protein
MGDHDGMILIINLQFGMAHPQILPLTTMDHQRGENILSVLIVEN